MGTPLRPGHATQQLRCQMGATRRYLAGGNSDKDFFYANVALLDTLIWQWCTPKLQVWLVSLLAAEQALGGTLPR